MTPFGFSLLADENVHSAVIAALQARSMDVVTVVSAGLVGQDDVALLRHAYANRRVVITHDADFGTLAVQDHSSTSGPYSSRVCPANDRGYPIDRDRR